MYNGFIIEVYWKTKIRINNCLQVFFKYPDTYIYIYIIIRTYFFKFIPIKYIDDIRVLIEK